MLGRNDGVCGAGCEWGNFLLKFLALNSNFCVIIAFMSKDELREIVAEFYDKWQQSNESAKKLDEFKFYRGIVVGLIISIIGSLLLSYKTLEKVIIFGGVGVVVVLLIVWVALIVGINYKIKEMKGD